MPGRPGPSKEREGLLIIVCAVRILVGKCEKRAPEAGPRLGRGWAKPEPPCSYQVVETQASRHWVCGVPSCLSGLLLDFCLIIKLTTLSQEKRIHLC